MKPELYLFEITRGNMLGDWRHALEKRADSAPVEYDIRGQKLRIWNPAQPARKSPRDDIFYRDGMQLQRVDLGGQHTRVAIGLSICRLYFEKDSKFPVMESQAELFGVGASPEVPRHLQILSEVMALLKSFNGNDPIITPLADIQYSTISKFVSFRFGDCSSASLDMLSRNSYSKCILARVRDRAAINPVNLHLALLPTFCRDPQKAKSFAGIVSDVLQKEWNCSITKALISDENQLENWKTKSSGSPRIVLVALDGKKGQRPHESLMDWLGRLSDDGIPFQLFSTQTNPRYARHGTACAILAKTGGLLYQVRAHSVPDLSEHWCIGLDLGFGGEYEGRIAVITLTDGSGALCAYWRALQDKDETLTEEVLRDGLRWIITKAESLAPGRKFLAFRDGSRPKHEKLEIYAELLPHGRSTFIELSKSGNPLFVDSEAAPAPGTFGVAPESDRHFLYPAVSPQNDVLTSPVKFFTTHNDLGYSMQQLTEIITALCHVPTLSFQPCSLPAPIYWADGLAGLSHSNLQFAGWSHLPNQTRDLRNH